MKLLINLYGTIFNVASKKTLAKMFQEKGWQMRKLTWADFEDSMKWLPPGWRFLITEDYEDVWEDSSLLNI